MKSREEAVALIGRQFDINKGDGSDLEKGGCVHYGLQELRELMDFIYDERPSKSEEELIVQIKTWY